MGDGGGKEFVYTSGWFVQARHNGRQEGKISTKAKVKGCARHLYTSRVK